MLQLIGVHAFIVQLVDNNSVAHIILVLLFSFSMHASPTELPPHIATARQCEL
jgi:hypothetical protein